MSFAIFQRESDATAYIAACDADLGLPKPGDPVEPQPYGWTMTWADVLVHPGGSPFAVAVCETVQPPVGTLIVDDLSADWFPPPPWSTP